MDNSRGSLWKRIVNNQVSLLVVIFIVLLVVFQVWNRNFLSGTNIITMMNSAGLYGIIAVGMAILIISGQVDLSAGYVGCLAGVLVSMFMEWYKIPWPVALLLAIGVGMLCGLASAALVIYLKFPNFIATLAVANVCNGLVYVITNAASVPISNKFFMAVGGSTVGPFSSVFIITVGLFIIYGCMLKFTKFGRQIYMCGGNPAAARLAGINSVKITFFAFINCSALSALAGILLASRMGVGSPMSVVGADLTSITAVVLGGIAFTGGTGTMLGAFVGVCILTAFSNALIVIGLDADFQIMATGILLIIALIIDYYRSRGRERRMKKEAKEIALRKSVNKEHK